MYQEITDYFKQLSLQLINGCKSTAYDGTCLYTPDGISSYNALWIRDFSYMVEYAGFAIPDEDVIGCIEYSIRHKRADGWMPDRTYGNGTGVYAAGEAGAPIGEANLDNTPFLIFTVYCLLQRQKELSSDAAALFGTWEPDLTAGMELIPLSPQGLVYNDPNCPHSPYGFTDTVCKTGELFMESLLFWRACRMMASLCQTFHTGPSLFYQEKAAKIEQNIHSLFQDKAGAFLAASKDCSQLDIWGNAYLLYIDFPCRDSVRQSILHFLTANCGQFLYHGQVRHLLQGEYWDRLLIEVPQETYQNGAYWATATGWIIWCLAQKDFALAANALTAAAAYFKEQGSFECVNENYQKLDSMVVSATNLYGGALRLQEFPEFIAFLDQTCSLHEG